MAPTASLSDAQAASSVMARMRAIDRVMAVIEFDLEGRIVDANANFLEALGYRLEEVQGRHHRMFVGADYASSPAYSDHWKRLAQGEFVTGEFQRVSKSGREVWIKASYNPLLGDDGQPYGVVKYASDITAEVLAARERSQFLEEASVILNQAAAGDLTARMAGEYGGELGEFKKTVNELLCSTLEAIDSIVAGTSPLASASEELNATSDQLHIGSATFNDRAREMQGSAELVAENIAMLASGTEELSESISEIARSAGSAASIAEEAVSEARHTNATIVQLGESSDQIGQVIKVITSIAQQTNLLALNATIEAARAGDAGKGFAVVANEVKELAKETARATEDIGVRVTAIQSATRESEQAIEKISSVIDQISKTQLTIASAVDEQKATTNDMAGSATSASRQAQGIAEGIKEVVEASSESAHAADGVQAASGELARMATTLHGAVGRFKLH